MPRRQSRSKSVMRDLKRQGVPAGATWALIRKSVTDCAGAWRPSERAIMLASRWRELVSVYGKRATAKLSPGGH